LNFQSSSKEEKEGEKKGSVKKEAGTKGEEDER
jgi:hypothetical protein